VFVTEHHLIGVPLKFAKNSHWCQRRVTFADYSSAAHNTVGVSVGRMICASGVVELRRSAWTYVATFF